MNRRRFTALAATMLAVPLAHGGSRSGRMPRWSIPPNIRDLVAADSGKTWEERSWAPILLTVMGDTNYKSRAIPLAWEIEFQPTDRACKSANAKLKSLGLVPDGDGWSGYIRSELLKHHPTVESELHDDSEAATCVIWVETEQSCKVLMEATWQLIHQS